MALGFDIELDPISPPVTTTDVVITVRNSATHDPIPGIVVVLTWQPPFPDPGAQPEPLQSITGANGVAVFTALPINRAWGVSCNQGIGGAPVKTGFGGASSTITTVIPP